MTSEKKPRWNPPAKAKGKGASPALTPWQAAVAPATGESPRKEVKGDVFVSLETSAETVPKDKEGRRLSSYPHLTLLDPQTKRAEHVTNIRAVGEAKVEGARFIIHERFHVDNVVNARPTHDRFLASDEKGRVYSATSAFAASERIPTKFQTQPLQKGSSVLEDERRKLLVFKVGAADDKHPPLSPRSQKRT